MTSKICPSNKILAYIATTFGYVLMHNIFSFYYVKIFLNYYHVSPWWFQISQLVFMIWNTINDPLFGYFQDNSKLAIFRKRRLSILIGAPFYGLSFMVAWIPFSNYGVDVPSWAVGVHLMSALCLYDTLFTFVLLAHCCLFAEMEVDFQNRLNMKWWSVLASLCGGMAVPMTNHVSDNLACMSCFRIACICVAFVSVCCMLYTGLFASTVYDDAPHKESLVATQPASVESRESIWCLTAQIMRERDFHGFVWLNFLHQGHSVFWANFTSIFIDFIAPGLTTSFLNIYFAALWTIPPLSLLLCRSFIERVGYYRLIRASCVLKIVFSLLSWSLGRYPVVFLTYLLIDTIVTHSTSNFFDLALSDIADKDCLLYKRTKPISSMIFATNALLTKPAISLFPMLVVAVLTQYGYQHKSQHSDGALGTSVNQIGQSLLPDVVFALSCGIPFSVGLLQLVSWSFFTIRTSHNRSGPLSTIHM